MKKIKNWLINNAIVLGLALIIIVILASVTYIFVLKKQNNRMERAMVNMQSGFQEEFNKSEEKIFTQMQTILSQKQAIEAGLLDIEQLEANNMKLIQAQVLLQERISNMTEIIANFDTTAVIEYIEVEGEIDTDKWLKLPARFSYKSEWIDLWATVQYPEGLVLQPGQLVIRSEPIITIGERNKYNSRIRNFFSSPDKVVIYENKNPHINVVGMENVVIDEQKKFYQRNWFWFTVGVATGIIVLN